MLQHIKNYAERALQHLVVLTSVFPFTLLYAAYYRLTLKIVVLTARLIPEVVSVYVGGGSATREVVFGLSDIDPIILVKGDATRTRKIYSLLAALFPLLKDKHSIRPIDEIAVWYRPPGRLAPEAPVQGAIRRLYGVDYFPNHKETTEDQAFINWIAYLWSWIIRCVIYGSKNHLIRNYHCYKLLRKMGCPGFPRLRDARRLMRLPNLSEKAYRYAVELLKKKESLLNEGIIPSPNVATTIALTSFHVPLSERNREVIAEAKAFLDLAYPGTVVAVLAAAVTPLAIDEANIGVFFVLREELSLEAVRKLNKIFYSNQQQQFCTPYIVLSCSAYSISHIDFDPSSNVILSWSSHPLVFLALTQQSAILSGSALQIEQSILVGYFKARHDSYITKAKSYILASVSHPNIIRVPHLDFQMLFWQGLQIKLIEQNATYIFSSKALCDICKCENGLAWLNEMHQEYLKTLAGDQSDTEKFYQRALKLLVETDNSAVQAKAIGL